MSNSGEPCPFKAYWTERVGDQIVFRTKFVPVPHDCSPSYADALRRNGLELVSALENPAYVASVFSEAHEREFRREEYQRQRPDYPSRYDQIMQWSASEPEPPARRRRKPKPILLKCNTPGIVELHRLYLAMGQTADEFAYYCGITRKQLFEYFDNRRHPSPEVRERIKSRTGVDVGGPPPRRQRQPHPFFTNAGSANRRVRGDIADHRETIDRLHPGKRRP